MSQSQSGKRTQPLSPGGPRLSGRVDLSDPAGPRFAWSGVSLHVRFTGPSLTVRFRDSRDYFGVVLDGVPWATIRARPARERYVVASELDEGVHEAVISKRTEPLVGEAQLVGFDLAPGGRLLPPSPPPTRRLELIGDSITAGFGVLGRDETCPFTPATEDFSASYGAHVARALAAEVHVVAWSGRGLCRNYDDEPGDLLPVLFERTLPARADSRWDPAAWIPDAVLLNAGTNDFSTGVLPRAAFTEAYLSLVRRLCAVYPEAFIGCLLGPMLTDEALSAARAAITEVVSLLRGDGVDRLQLIEVPPQSAADGYGCDWHPSAATHRRMAEQVTRELRRALGW